MALSDERIDTLNYQQLVAFNPKRGEHFEDVHDRLERVRNRLKILNRVQKLDRGVLERVAIAAFMSVDDYNEYLNLADFSDAVILDPDRYM